MSVAEHKDLLKEWIVAVVQSRKEKEARRGNSITERFKELGLSIISNKDDEGLLTHTYEGRRVSPFGVILVGEEIKGGNPPFMFWRGNHLGRDVSVFWVKRSFGQFTRDQVHATLQLATQGDISIPPDLNDWKLEKGIPRDIVDIIHSYYPVDL